MLKLPISRCPSLLLLSAAISLSALCGGEQARAQGDRFNLGEAVNPPPGLLQNFLRNHPDAARQEQVVAVLGSEATGKATFTAIIARDPSNASSVAKGILIRLEDSRNKTAVYLDDDIEADHNNLKDSEQRLRFLASEGEETALASLRERHPEGGFLTTVSEQCTSEAQQANCSPRYFAVTTSLQNRPGTQPAYCCPRYTVFNAGWYGDKRWEFAGVTMNAPGAVREPGSKPHRYYYFPEAKLDQVAEAIAKARAFLDAH